MPRHNSLLWSVRKSYLLSYGILSNMFQTLSSHLSYKLTCQCSGYEALSYSVACFVITIYLTANKSHTVPAPWVRERQANTAHPTTTCENPM